MAHLTNINSPTDLKGLTSEELQELSAELRQEILSVLSQTGGHLGSNLGAVELTVALHYVFDLPTDRIIWDVSHQAYAHKLLTGRKDRFHTIRQHGGLSGYAKRDESEYDAFGAGHASTSISAALGFAIARDLAGLEHKVVAVIGDGSMTGGLAFEGLNNAGSLKKDLLVILNDNTWSISKNVGAISRYLTTVMADEKVRKLRSEIWEFTGRFKRRDKIRATVQRLEKSLKSLLVPGMLFENMGFRYFGPIDGHNVPQLIQTLNDLKDMREPVLLHVGTVKGKGYEPAENDALKFHGVGKFDKITGKAAGKSGTNLPAYTRVYGDIACELAGKNDKVVAITAAMASGTGLVEFAERFPERFFDVGIAEGHAACFAAGLAAEGIRPLLTVYSTFMQRAYDQIIHDMAIQNLPVTICMDRGGLVGNDGPTHHGVFDLSYLNPIPNLTLCVPKDGNELRAMLHHATCADDPGVIAVRYPRESVPVPMTDEVAPLEWGSWEELSPESDIIVLAVGTMVHESLRAIETLESQGGPTITLVNARFVKPLDTEALERYLARARLIVTIEENQLLGGFGSSVAQFLLQHGYKGSFRSIGIEDSFTTHGSRGELLQDVGLNGESIATAIRELADGIGKPNVILRKLGFRRNGLSSRRDLSSVSLTGTDSD